MIKNYLKIALRTFWRDRAFSLINIAGLAIGLASVLMIMAYVRYELSYDTGYSNSPNVYRVSMAARINNAEQENIWVPTALGPTLKKEVRGVDAYAIFYQHDLQFKNKSGVVSIGAISATADFFKLFNFQFISGNAGTALKEPNSVVITESTAKQYFNGTNAVGKTIDVAYAKKPYVITGIIKDIPSNTHFTGNAIVSMEGSRALTTELDMKGYTGMPQYLLINKNNKATDIEAQFTSLYKKYGFNKSTLKLTQVQNIHLYSHTESELMPNSDIKYIYIFLSIAVLILLVACINYINLTTARSIQRAREIGVRKVLGAVKKQLIAQFLSESFLFFTVCLFLGLVLAVACWPAFSVVINPAGTSIPLFDVTSLILLPLVVLAFGLLSGLYPAFILTKVKTTQVLKGINAFGINVSIRKVLVAVQFVISGVLIVSTIIIYQQLDFISNARLGFNKDHLITVPYFMFNSHVNAFKDELKSNPDVKSISVASWSPGKYFGESGGIKDPQDTSKTLSIEIINADPDFVKAMGINIVEGRGFSGDDIARNLGISKQLDKLSWDDPNYKTIATGRSILLNEEAVKLLHIAYKENMVVNNQVIQGRAIGVTGNFNGMSLHQKIPALAIKCQPDLEFGLMYVRLSSNNMAKSLAFIGKKWKEFYPEETFKFSFVDDDLQKLYSADKRVGRLFGTFATLAILIACLGLFALISLTVQQKVKEIGIRKVLGAGVGNIVALLSTDFLKLVMLSMLIATPVAWYIMNKWLQDFAYRISIEWWVFAVAALGAFAVSFITISFQSIKAAIANPVKSLRSE